MSWELISFFSFVEQLEEVFASIAFFQYVANVVNVCSRLVQFYVTVRRLISIKNITADSFVLVQYRILTSNSYMFQFNRCYVAVTAVPLVWERNNIKGKTWFNDLIIV